MSAVEVRITDPKMPATSRRRWLGSLVALTKPRIIELLLVTTVPAMILADHSWPGTWLVVTTLIGGTLSAGGANAINNVIDRDIDAEMRRTAHRPLPSHRIEPGPALVFGVVLGVAGFLWLWATTNLLAAGLSTGALLFYVFVYTLYLKRSSTQNIVIGGAAGAVPALVGWAAVEGSLALPAWIMFAIVFFWTPPTSGPCRCATARTMPVPEFQCCRSSRGRRPPCEASGCTACSCSPSLWCCSPRPR